MLHSKIEQMLEILDKLTTSEDVFKFKEDDRYTSTNKFLLSIENYLLNWLFEDKNVPSYITFNIGQQKEMMLAYLKDCYRLEQLELIISPEEFLNSFTIQREWYSKKNLKKAIFNFLQREERFKEARKIGLRCVGVMQEWSHIDPRAFLAYEKIAKPYSNHKNLDSKNPKLFDRLGYRGVSGEAIQRIWYICGKKLSKKYHECLKTLVAIRNFGLNSQEHWLGMLNRHMSASEVKYLGKGFLWYCTRVGYTTWLSPKKYIYLGRVSLPMRWAMLEFNFDWDKISKFQSYSMEYKCRIMSIEDQWRYMHKKIPLEIDTLTWDICPIRLRLQKKGVPVFFNLINRLQVRASIDMALPVYNLSVLIGNVNEIDRYVAKFAKELDVVLDRNTWHEAGQFVLPKGKWTPSKWKSLVFKYPVKVRKYVAHFSKIEGNNIPIPTSLNELRDVCSRFHYDEVNSDEVELAKVCHEQSVSNSSWDAYRELFHQQKDSEMCPHVDITDGDFRIRKLHYNDPLGLVIGLITNCCQNLDSAAKSCVKHGWREPSGAFYVVEYKGKVIAQSWAWRSEKDTLVFDSIEAHEGYGDGKIGKMYKKAAYQMLGKLMIEAVMVGDTGYGVSRKVIKDYKPRKGFYSNEFEDSPISPAKYMDGKIHHCISALTRSSRKII